MARGLRVESLEQRMMLAANIEVSGDMLLLTDNVAGGSENNVAMDFTAGVLTISDSSGLTGLGPLGLLVTGNKLTIDAADLITLGITDIVLDTGEADDAVTIKGTPDNTVVTTFTGVTSVRGGDDDDTIVLGKVASLDDFLSPVDVDGGSGDDFLDVRDFLGTPDTLVTITSSSVTGIAPADITYLAIETLTVDVVDGAPASIAIESTSAVTQVVLDSGASEVITIGDAGDFSGIQGPVF